MKIKEILVRKECIFCSGRGCYDCNNKGYEEDWISMEDFILIFISMLRKLKLDR